MNGNTGGGRFGAGNPPWGGVVLYGGSPWPENPWPQPQPWQPSPIYLREALKKLLEGLNTNMFTLHPCNKCQRHIQGPECPFCLVEKLVPEAVQAAQAQLQEKMVRLQVVRTQLHELVERIKERTAQNHADQELCSQLMGELDELLRDE